MANTIPLTVANFETALDNEVVAGDTTATLLSVEDTDGNTLANGLYAFTADGDVENAKEFIIATITGTALSGVISISDQGAVTNGFTKFHRRGASIAVTDWAILNRLAVGIGTNAALDPAVHVGYSGAPTGLTGNEFATVAYVLSVVSGGTVNLGQQVIAAQTAGEGLTALDHIYFKESDQKWYKVDADLTATYQQVRHGITLSTVTTNNSFTAVISGTISGFVSLTAGSKYYASNTAGAISTSTGTNIVFVGWALSTTILLFDPYGRDIPYGAEKDALGGSSGTPSSTNKYLVQESQFSSDTDQVQTTQDTTQVVGAANSTTNKNKLGQSFIAGRVKTRGVALYKAADTGTFTGTVTISLQADSAGSPSGSALATNTITNAIWLLTPTGEFKSVFTTEYSMTPGTTYWIVIQTSTADNSNHPNLGFNSAGGYASGSSKYNNTTDGWVAIATQDMYFKVLTGVLSQVAETDATTGIVPPVISAHSFISLDSTTQTLTGTTAETTAFTKQLPSTALKTNSGIRYRIPLQVASASARSLDLKVKINGTTIVTHTISNSSVTLNGYVEGTILNTTTSAQSFLSTQSMISATIVQVSNQNGTASVDVTAGGLLTITLTNNNNDLTTTYYGLTLEKIAL